MNSGNILAWSLLAPVAVLTAISAVIERPWLLAIPPALFAAWVAAIAVRDCRKTRQDAADDMERAWKTPDEIAAEIRQAAPDDQRP